MFWLEMRLHATISNTIYNILQGPGRPSKWHSRSTNYSGRYTKCNLVPSFMISPRAKKKKPSSPSYTFSGQKKHQAKHPKLHKSHSKKPSPSWSRKITELLRRHQGLSRSAQSHKVPQALSRFGHRCIWAEEAFFDGHVDGKQNEAAEGWFQVPGLRMVGWRCVPLRC